VYAAPDGVAERAVTMTTPTMTPSPPPQTPIRLEAAGQSSFLYRVIHILAFVLIAYAALHLLQYTLYFTIQGTTWRRVSGPSRWIERATEVSSVCAMVLLLAGAVGMLKGKSWSRPAVMWWAVIQVLIGLVSSAAWVVRYSSDVAAVRATTQASYMQPVWQMMLWQVMWWVLNAFFPLLVWLILRQPDVANFFSHVRGGGFEVVPFANAVATDAAVREGVTDAPTG
jgi:hypothetical protein